MTIDIDRMAALARHGAAAAPDAVLALIARLREAEAREQALAARYSALADEVRAMIHDSDGLAGYHLNGDVACWSEFEVGHLLGEPEDLGEKVLARRDAEQFRQGFWWGFERARCHPDQTNIRAEYEDVEELRRRRAQQADTAGEAS